MKKKYVLIFILGLLTTKSVAQIWLPLGNGVSPQHQYDAVWVNALTVDTLNNLLYVGGVFYYAGDTISRNLAIWDGNNWITTEDSNKYVPKEVTAMFMLHDTLLYAHGSGIGRYAHHHFLNVLPNPGGEVYAFCMYHDMLYVGGDYGVGIKKWNKKEWEIVGGGINALIPGHVNALFVYQDQLIVGGLFKFAGDSIVNNIAAWDGSRWHSLDGGTVYSGSKYLGTVYSLAEYQNNLIASGLFDSAGGAYCNNFAMWNGSSWAPLDDNSVCGIGYGMQIHDSLLYVVGEMFKGSGNCLIARAGTWDGKEWNDLNFTNSDIALTLSFFENQLYVGGTFTRAQSNDLNRIARLTYATGINQLSENNTFRITPNPSTDQIQIQSQTSNQKIISILTLLGHVVYQNTFYSSESINVSSFPKGMYIVQITDQQGNLIGTEKLVKE